MSERKNYPVQQVPRDESGRLELLALRPPLWEYLLFGNALYRSRDVHEARWRDYQLGYALHIGPVVKAEQIPDVMSERFSHVGAIAANLEAVASPYAQARAFGAPGEPGDPALIEHMASRLIDIYALLLGWVEETRSLRVPEWAENLKALAIAYAAQPIQRTHEFVDEFIARLERAIANLVDGNSNYEEISIRVTFEIPDDVARQFSRELKRVKPHFR
ncbi:hypothetical protein AB0B85_15240 [Micromonospora sp. NPDC049044]|uniref:hypothetical protein n=1 Tax=Micromonospora sp. NPDC049044 TaxID=3154827 RepID=UPI00340FBEE4